MNATVTAQSLRQQAADCRRRSAESWDRSDTGGFLSQWSGDLTDAGGRREFEALFDLDGNLVAAKSLRTQYGWARGILADDDPHSDVVRWFNESKAQNPKQARVNNARKGFYIGRVLAPAAAKIGGSGTGMSGLTSCSVVIYRTDGGFSRDVEIVDHGQ